MDATFSSLEFALGATRLASRAATLVLPGRLVWDGRNVHARIGVKEVDRFQMEAHLETKNNACESQDIR